MALAQGTAWDELVTRAKQAGAEWASIPPSSGSTATLDTGGDTAEWPLLFYFEGDDGLDGQMMADLTAWESAELPENVSTESFVGALGTFVDDALLLLDGDGWEWLYRQWCASEALPATTWPADMTLRQTGYHDLLSFMDRVAAGAPNLTLRYDAEDVCEQIEATIPGGGLSIYGASEESGRHEEFTSQSVQFLADTRWMELVDTMFSHMPDELVPLRDWAEGNETVDSAHALPKLSGPDVIFPALTIHSSTDVDWFSFETVADGQAGDQVSIVFDHNVGDVDLFVYDAGNELVGSSTSQTHDEAVSLEGKPAGEYWIKVVGKDGAVSPQYTLEIDAPQPASPADDWAETGDTRDAAYDLGLLWGDGYSFVDLSLLDAADWYRFEIVCGADQHTAAQIQFSHDAGDLDLRLYNENGDLSGASEGAEDTESVSLAGLSTGTYYLEVFGKAGATNGAYTLFIDAPTAISTIDASPPQSQVVPLAAQMGQPRFRVSWEGTDVGSGIASYDIYVSKNGGDYLPWQKATPFASATYSGEAGASYAFYSVAHDVAGHVEPAPRVADAQTEVVADPAPIVTDEHIVVVIAEDLMTAGVADVGDVVRVIWDSSASGNNNNDIASVTADLTQFGGLADAPLYDDRTHGDVRADDCIWIGEYTIVAGQVEATNRNVKVTATDAGGSSTDAWDTSNVSVDNMFAHVPQELTFENGARVIVVDTDTTDDITLSSTDPTADVFVVANAAANTIARIDLQNDFTGLGLICVGDVDTIRDTRGADARDLEFLWVEGSLGQTDLRSDIAGTNLNGAVVSLDSGDFDFDPRAGGDPDGDSLRMGATGVWVSGDVDRLEVTGAVDGNVVIGGAAGWVVIQGSLGNQHTGEDLLRVGRGLTGLRIGQHLDLPVVVGHGIGLVEITGAVTSKGGVMSGTVDAGADDLFGTADDVLMANVDPTVVTGIDYVSVGGSLSGQVLVRSDLGDLLIGGDLGGELDVSGDTATIDAYGAVAGSIEIAGNLLSMNAHQGTSAGSSISVGGDLGQWVRVTRNGRRRWVQRGFWSGGDVAGPMSIDGTACLVDVHGQLQASLTVAGDAERVVTYQGAAAAGDVEVTGHLGYFWTGGDSFAGDLSAGSLGEAYYHTTNGIEGAITIGGDAERIESRYGVIQAPIDVAGDLWRLDAYEGISAQGAVNVTGDLGRMFRYDRNGRRRWVTEGFWSGGDALGAVTVGGRAWVIDVDGALGGDLTIGDDADLIDIADEATGAITVGQSKTTGGAGGDLPYFACGGVLAGGLTVYGDAGQVVAHGKTQAPVDIQGDLQQLDAHQGTSTAGTIDVAGELGRQYIYRSRGRRRLATEGLWSGGEVASGVTVGGGAWLIDIDGDLSGALTVGASKATGGPGGDLFSFDCAGATAGAVTVYGNVTHLAAHGQIRAAVDIQGDAQQLDLYQGTSSGGTVNVTGDLGARYSYKRRGKRRWVTQGLWSGTDVGAAITVGGTAWLIDVGGQLQADVQVGANKEAGGAGGDLYELRCTGSVAGAVRVYGNVESFVCDGAIQSAVAVDGNLMRFDAAEGISTKATIDVGGDLGQSYSYKRNGKRRWATLGLSSGGDVLCDVTVGGKACLIDVAGDLVDASIAANELETVKVAGTIRSAAPEWIRSLLAGASFHISDSTWSGYVSDDLPYVFDSSVTARVG